jgi:hypothetical protein
LTTPSCIPCGEAVLAVALHGVGGHRDDARALAGRPALHDATRRLEAIHIRHLHVHRHHVVDLALDRLDRLEAVAGHVGPVAELLEQPHREPLVHHIVLGEADAQRPAVRPECNRDALRETLFPYQRQRRRLPVLAGPQ